MMIFGHPATLSESVIGMNFLLGRAADVASTGYASVLRRTYNKPLRVVRPPPAHCFATLGSLPATQGQR